MFEVTQRGATTSVKTKTGIYKIKMSPRYKRYQIFKDGKLINESFAGWQGALNIVSTL